MGTHVRIHRLVDRAPPNFILGRLFFHNTLVGGRATSLGTGVGGQSAVGCDGGTRLVDQGIFVKGGD